MDDDGVTIEHVNSGHSRLGVPYHTVKISSSPQVTSVFDLPTYLVVQGVVGRGTNGMVVSALDTRSDQRLVAVKKLRRALCKSDARDLKRELWEVRLLRQLRHENLLGLLDLLLPSEEGSAQGDMYLVTPLLESDLFKIITSGQPLSDQHVQFFVYQLLLALKYLHSAGVIHRDVKPSNVMLNSNCCIKLGDYGLSRPCASSAGDLTEYVVTRWYRAPEVMLSKSHYGPNIDLWGVGCVMAELLGRKALFPGKDYLHLLQLITEVLGSPSEEKDLAFVTSEKAREYLRRLPRHAGVPFATLFPGANPLGLELLAGLLQFNPERRLTAEQALAHPYLASLHSDNPRDEPTCSERIDLHLDPAAAEEGSKAPPEGSDNGIGRGGGGEGEVGAALEANSVERLRQLLWEEARLVRPGLPPHPPLQLPGFLGAQ